MLIVYYAELAGSHSVNGLLGMNHPFAILQLFYRGRMVFWGMANLEGYLLHRHLMGEEMEIVEGEILLVCRLGVVAMAHVEDVVLHVLLDDKPWTAAKAQALALTDGVKPQALVLADALARLQLYHIARVLAQITADIVIIIDLPQEADALAILALGIHQMLLLSYLSNFIFHMMTDRKYRFS